MVKHATASTSSSGEEDNHRPTTDRSSFDGISLGLAVSVTLILKDWSTHGIEERVCYHHHRLRQPQERSVDSSSNGISRVLECLLQNKPKKKHRTRDILLHHERIPWNWQTRVYFGYERIRMAFCVDASPTMVSTYGEIDRTEGSSGSSGTGAAVVCCCPMDRLVSMARLYWRSLVTMEYTNTNPAWNPVISITVLAVYPCRRRHRGKTFTNTTTSLLVRDFRLSDLESANVLAAQFEEWCYTVVETDIAKTIGSCGTDDYLESHTSSLQSLWMASQAALSTLSSKARPLVVIATDARSLSMGEETNDGGVLDWVTKTDRVDIPLHILDVSSPFAHQMVSIRASNSLGTDTQQFYSKYQSGIASFPLYLSDDSETVYRIAKATGGAVWDEELLLRASQERSGRVNASATTSPNSSLLASDPWFAFPRHTIQLNGIQWYTLFSLSPLSPTLHAGWGELCPPAYIRNRHASVSTTEQQSATTGSTFLTSIRQGTLSLAAPSDKIGNIEKGGVSSALRHLSKNTSSRTTISIYVINPIPIDEILLMRIKEGYRVKRRSKAIQFVLPLLDHLGTTIHYELSYQPLSDAKNRTVGSAHIKVDISGNDPAFLWSVKKDFISTMTTSMQHGKQKSGSRMAHFATITQRISARLCTHLRWIRKEDMLQSYLSPPRWTDQLSSPGTPFLRRLATLTDHQRRRHFRLDEFDCVCVGNLPWNDDEFLAEFRDTDDGREKLLRKIQEWSTHCIRQGQFYVKQTDPDCGVNGYCLIEVVYNPNASRVITVIVETFGGTSSNTRCALLASLKNVLRTLLTVKVLPKQIGKFAVATNSQEREGLNDPFHRQLMQSQHNHASWDLVKDPELLPLIMKRRKEIGNFHLLELTDSLCIFARLNSPGEIEDENNPGDFVQYQLSVSDEKVVVDLYVEFEGGVFFPSRKRKDRPESPKFHNLVKGLKIRDQECGHALQCRTRLLQAFEDCRKPDYNELAEIYHGCVQKLLPYASSNILRLRFFRPGSDDANDILLSLTEDMLLSQSLGAKVTKLPITAELLMDDLDPGEWFLVEYDRHTSSMVHLSFRDKNDASPDRDSEDSLIFRELTFYTFGIPDLYRKRADITDDDSDDDHISEHLRVSEFHEAVLLAHKQNFSSAAYITLKNAMESMNENCIEATDQQEYLHPRLYFNLDDFVAVMNSLEFVEVARVVLDGETHAGQEGRKQSQSLYQLLDSVLHLIENEHDCVFYSRKQDDDDLFPMQDHDSQSSDVFDDVSTEASDNDVGEGCADEGAASLKSRTTDDKCTDDSVGLNSSICEVSLEQSFCPVPIFFRFLLNGKPVPYLQAADVSKRLELSALISIFNTTDVPQSDFRPVDPAELPFSHLCPAIEIDALLKAHVAEQKLERMRSMGEAMQDVDIRLARSCLRKAKRVISSSVEVFFYVGKADALVAASVPGNSVLEVEEGFHLLTDEFQRNSWTNLKSYDLEGSFLVEEINALNSFLAYWCFVKINKKKGIIFIDIHHPVGVQAAKELMEKTLKIIDTACHKVNQILLLRRLHRTRTASRLLLPPDPTVSIEDGISLLTEGDASQEGLFSCPIVYRTSFELYHRCATNPAQVIRTLEATVLHIFAVSNRRQVFVYKDETGFVFYMTLSIVDTTVPFEQIAGRSGPRIELRVHGVVEPGPSVTVQLRRLLQKKLLQIAVEMLSTVLTKNPDYHWKQQDISFVRSFEDEREAVENGESVRSPTNHQKTYAFPVTVYDPAMIILFFRQNLCGSTFFHPVSYAEGNVNFDHTVDPVKPGLVRFDSSFDLTFYYNGSPSKLNPNFQSESTLTSKGAAFARQAGAGLAIIEVAVLSNEGKPIQDVRAAVQTEESEALLSVSLESLLLIEVDGDTCSFASENGTTTFVQVTITDTALNRNILHEWIVLSINQVLVSWCVERLLERKQSGLIRPPLLLPSQGIYKKTNSKKETIESLCSGLPILADIFEVSQSLPHPAIRKAECTGVVQSSVVASFALDLLERGIFDTFRSENKTKVNIDYHSQLCVIRSSRGSRPRQVHLERDPAGQVVVRNSSRGNDSCLQIKDSPIDCPEYIILFFTPIYGNVKSDNNDMGLPKLFQEISVGHRSSSDSGQSPSHLEDFKREKSWCFRLSFAFVLTVKRDRRTLLTYNWSNALFNSSLTRIKERDNAVFALSNQRVYTLQRRSMMYLAPETIHKSRKKSAKEKEQPQRRPSLNAPSDVSGKTNLEATVSQGNDYDLPPSCTRRIKRPQTIRKPKLVGKSVEGAAMQAVAQSRARASANRFRTAVNPTAAQPQKATADERKNISTAKNVPDLQRRPPRIQEKSKIQLKVEDTQLKDLERRGVELLYQQRLMRQSSIQAMVQMSLTKARWPLKREQSVSAAVADFLFSLGRLAWIESSETLLFPNKMMRSFVISLVFMMASWLPDLKVVQTQKAGKDNSSLFLMSRPRHLKLWTCFIVVKLSLEKNKNNEGIVTSEGRILIVPRKEKPGIDRSNNRSLMEKDAAALDKLATDVHSHISLPGSLVDHACSMIERTLKSLDGMLQFSDTICLLRQLIKKYPLRSAMSLKSNYKCYEANIILRSYKNKLIDQYDGPTLFNWLSANFQKRKLLNCGTGLCFTREIVVRITHSRCFLCCDDSNLHNMKLVVLCRTQGTNLNEYVIREDSKLAFSISDSIAIEAAGIAFKELRVAAQNLRKESLWALLSGKTFSRVPTSAEIAEFLALCIVQPIEKSFESSNEMQRFGLVYKKLHLFDANRLVDSMKTDPAFSPAWDMIGDDGCSMQHLFYIGSDDIFLLVRGRGSASVKIDVVLQDKNKIDHNGVAALQRLSNYLLHFMWSQIAEQ